MMTERFNLFYAGFTAYAPSLYFNRLSIAARHSANEEGILPCVSKLKDETLANSDEFRSYMKTVESIASNFNLKLLDIPEDFTEYFPWLNNCTEQFEKLFPMSRIDHYYFLYARKMAEIICNAGLVETYVSLHIDSDGTLDMISGIEKCVRDTEYTLFKLVASSALLSSEPRHAFVNANYKNISNDFQQFRHLNVSSLDKQSLKNLSSDMCAYGVKVKEGFKTCVGQLKELLN